MEHFEYVFILTSIIIGLGITHILTALSVAVNRLRGHGEFIKLDPIFIIWISYVMIWLVSFWWWEYKFQEINIEWTYGLYLFVITYAIVLFLLATILVPSHMEGVTDSYNHFMEGRKWFYGMHIIAGIVDIADTFLKGYDWGARPIYLIQIFVIIIPSIIGIVSTKKRIQFGIAILNLGMIIVYCFQELGVLGAW